MMRFVFAIVPWKYVVGIRGLPLREKLHRDSRYEPRVAGHNRKELLTSNDVKCFFFRDRILTMNSFWDQLFPSSIIVNSYSSDLMV